VKTSCRPVVKGVSTLVSGNSCRKRGVLQMNRLSGTSLGDYGVGVFERDNFTCAYCGFDGRTFDNWMQLSVDHILPKSSARDDSSENMVTACQSCNSITSRMRFSPDASR